jgi:hypothetical protein
MQPELNILAKGIKNYIMTLCVSKHKKTEPVKNKVPFFDLLLKFMPQANTS